MDSENNDSKHYWRDFKIPFPFKLHEMLSDSVKDGNEAIVSWQPHGQAFRVHDMKEFADTIMQRYFHQTHYKSFQRQLHIYGFRRISSGLDKGSYHHPLFVKGKMMASLRMTRCKIKGPLADVEVKDPNFYELEEPVGSGVVTMACPDQPRSDYLGRHVRSTPRFFHSEGTCAETVLSKAVSLPSLFLTRSTLGQEQQGQPQLRSNLSCADVTLTAPMMLLREEMPPHNMTFGGNANQTMTTMMLQDDFQPLPLNRIPHNRRMSLLEEGGESSFAGKKYFFVD